MALKGQSAKLAEKAKRCAKKGSPAWPACTEACLAEALEERLADRLAEALALFAGGAGLLGHSPPTRQSRRTEARKQLLSQTWQFFP